MQGGTLSHLGINNKELERDPGTAQPGGVTVLLFAVGSAFSRVLSSGRPLRGWEVAVNSVGVSGFLVCAQREDENESMCGEESSFSLTRTTSEVT